MHKYEDKNRGFKTEGDEVFVFVERNQIKYSVSQNRTLLKGILREPHKQRVVATPELY
jgi:hypothetical protein